MEISIICIECGEKLEYENHLVTTPEKRISVVAITPCKTCRPTPRALDFAICAPKYHASLDEAGDRFCRMCGRPLSQ